MNGESLQQLYERIHQDGWNYAYVVPQNMNKKQNILAFCRWLTSGSSQNLIPEYCRNARISCFWIHKNIYLLKVCRCGGCSYWRYSSPGKKRRWTNAQTSFSRRIYRWRKTAKHSLASNPTSLKNYAYVVWKCAYWRGRCCGDSDVEAYQTMEFSLKHYPWCKYRCPPQLHLAEEPHIMIILDLSPPRSDRSFVLPLPSSYTYKRLKKETQNFWDLFPPFAIVVIVGIAYHLLPCLTIKKEEVKNRSSSLSIGPLIWPVGGET